jgi:hypothetical protein
VPLKVGEPDGLSDQGRRVCPAAARHDDAGALFPESDGFTGAAATRIRTSPDFGVGKLTVSITFQIKRETTVQ